ncbi:NADH-quinone oxidoreductase subunit C [Emticicia fluvialis]|uniref:NADH-quinone oxidoreductase subunit C n=1 Tax=Emticicia fluvialis TaxID=2974474 RepID=UPI002165063F|nr:NADH-quinone oxidoreductase subunit C [Emticicia fluvialis]
MDFEQIKQVITDKFGETIVLKAESNVLQPSLTVPAESIVDVCTFMHENPNLYFDFLACITAIDNGPAVGTIEVIYNLTSIPYEHNFVLKVEVPRNAEGEPLPQVPSVAGIWRTADWHEREAFDLVGIDFTGHPDLRRILLPADWEGHPLRADYQEQEEYHSIKVKY